MMMTLFRSKKCIKRVLVINHVAWKAMEKKSFEEVAWSNLLTMRMIQKKLTSEQILRNNLCNSSALINQLKNSPTHCGKLCKYTRRSIEQKQCQSKSFFVVLVGRCQRSVDSFLHCSNYYVWCCSKNMRFYRFYCIAANVISLDRIAKVPIRSNAKLIKFYGTELPRGTIA